jgi:hypothetical protein
LEHQLGRSLSAVFMYVVYPQAQRQIAGMKEMICKSDILFVLNFYKKPFVLTSITKNNNTKNNNASLGQYLSYL